MSPADRPSSGVPSADGEARDDRGDARPQRANCADVVVLALLEAEFADRLDMAVQFDMSSVLDLRALGPDRSELALSAAAMVAEHIGAVDQARTAHYFGRAGT